MKFRFLIALLLLVFSAISLLAQDEEGGDMMEETPETRQSYFVCDWGLVTIEHSLAKPDTFIEIDSPQAYSAVEGTTFTLSGTGAGLPEGNVVVQVTGNGEVLFEGVTVLETDEIGGEGDWSLEVDLGELDEATQVFVQAFSPSPADGTTLAADGIDINANSEFPLRFVEVTRPFGSEGVSASPLLIEGMAGAAFENNIVIEVQDFESGDVLAETFATVETDELAGIGPFSTEVMLDVEPGTRIAVFAYQPDMSGMEEVTVSDTQFGVVSPLAQTYDRFLVIGSNDPLNMSDDLCAVAETEFENENKSPLVINNVEVISTRSMTPLVNVSIEAAGSSNCPSPLRTQIIRDESTYNIEVYLDTTEPFACTADLAPIPVRVSLGTLPDDQYTITVNGETVE